MNILTEHFNFPEYSQTSKDGIIAIGGDLSKERLELAYKKGIFPWFSDGEPILWWFPDPRFVLFPNELTISKSMQKIMSQNLFHFTENQSFEEVMRNCKEIKRIGQNGTWISEEMIKAYGQLHDIGMAKSIEVWQNEELVGGFYGVEVNQIFCGESMFAKVPNASKAGFIWFVQKFKSTYKLIDCQVYTNHLESLGAREIPAREFLKYLNNVNSN